MKRTAIAAISVTCLFLAACGRQPHTTSMRELDQAAAIDAGAEALSLLGQPLHSTPAPEAVQAGREEQLAEAEAALAQDPSDEAAIIWVGRRQAYLGRYRDTIATYTRGLALHADSYRLRRHRGHRYITTRQLDRAVADYTEAVRLIDGVQDQVEPDGQPNALNQPTSTDFTNIWYHLALAHYLRGEFASAARAWGECRDLSTNDDMRVAATYWLYISLRRSGAVEDAELLLSSISADLTIIENTAYHDLLLLFKGEKSVTDLAPDPDDDGVGDATLAYGIAMWHKFNGDDATAQVLFRRILEGPAWAAFGYIAAEAELARSTQADS